MKPTKLVGGPSKSDFEEATRMMEEWSKQLPTDFTLASRITRNGTKLFEDLYFKADPKVPGLYWAVVDPDYIMGRTRPPSSIEIKGPPDSAGRDHND